jgi:hypothetical protein
MSESLEKKSFLRETLELIDKYGIVRIIGAVILMIFVSYATYLSFNPSVIFERYDKYETERHYEMFDYRMQNLPYVQNNLNLLLNETEAIRTFVIELHNGKTNSAGLSFNYGTISYEALSDGVLSIREDYSDFSLDRYPLLVKVYNDGFWCGGVKKLSTIDNRLAHKVCANDGTYIALATIYGIRSEIGFVGVTFDGDVNISETELRKLLTKYASMISPLLDGEKVKQDKNR